MLKLGIVNMSPQSKFFFQRLRALKTKSRNPRKKRKVVSEVDVNRDILFESMKNGVKGAQKFIDFLSITTKNCNQKKKKSKKHKITRKKTN